MEDDSPFKSDNSFNDKSNINSTSNYPSNNQLINDPKTNTPIKPNASDNNKINNNNVGLDENGFMISLSDKQKSSITPKLNHHILENNSKKSNDNKISNQYDNDKYLSKDSTN